MNLSEFNDNIKNKRNNNNNNINYYCPSIRKICYMSIIIILRLGQIIICITRLSTVGSSVFEKVNNLL